MFDADQGVWTVDGNTERHGRRRRLETTWEGLSSMLRLLSRLVLATGIVIGASGAAFSDVFIRCPLTEVTASITNPLPGDWEAIPSTAKLTKTSVDDEGRGRERLQCIYGTLGTLELRAPRGETCEARQTGFRCETRRTRPREPRVLAEGVLRTSLAIPIDLDTGRLTQWAGGDILLQADNPFQNYIVPRGGAQLAKVGSNQPGPRDCERARYGTDRLPLIDLIKNNWVCFVTDQGRFGRFRVSGVVIFPLAIEIAYTTWE
jgi:hypothetical protein